MNKSKGVPKTKLSPRNFTKIKTISQVVSKNFAKILIYLFVYTCLHSGIVASKISNKSIEKVLRLNKHYQYTDVFKNPCVFFRLGAKA